MAHDEIREVERTLRPRAWSEFAGQVQVVRNLRLAIKAAHERKEALSHVLLSGPPGLGKTTLAHLMAAEFQVPCIETTASTFAKPGDLAGVLSALQANSFLFIDEIHGLKREVEEYLYSAMEDGRISIPLEGDGNVISITLNPFTLVGATTRPGHLSQAFHSRFVILERLDHYSAAELAQILARSAQVLKLKAKPEALALIAERGRGSARIANSILRRVRDVAQVEGSGEVDLTSTEQGLTYLKIDAAGLGDMDRRILTALVTARRPLGLKTLSSHVNEEEATIEDTYEPWLLQQGYIARSTAGRIATGKALTHLQSGGLVLTADRWESAPNLFPETS